MGNDILTHIQKPQQYIQHRKLSLPNHLRRVGSTNLQKIFGSQKKNEYQKSQSVPIFELRSVREQQQTYSQINQGDSLPFRQTVATTSINTQEQNETIHEFQNHVNELKARLFEQNFNSRNFSPVKYEQKADLGNKNVNKSTTRSKQHYFRLKGCQSVNKQNQISQ